MHEKKKLVATQKQCNADNIKGILKIINIKTITTTSTNHLIQL